MGLGHIVHHIVHTVHNVVHSVVHSIANIVHHVAHTVETVLHHVLSSVVHLISHIVSVVEHHFGMIAGTVLIALSVSSVLSWFNLNYAPLQNFIEHHPTIAKLMYWAGRIRQTVSAIYNSTLGRILQKVNPLLQKASALIHTILKPFHVVVHYLNLAVNHVKYSILGRIIAKLKPIADFLYNLRLIAMIKDYIDNKKYLKAFWTFLKATDEKIANEIQNEVAGIMSEIDQIRQEFYGTLESVNDSIKVVDAKANYLESTFQKLFKAFHVHLFEDLANGIHEFRQKVLEQAEEYVWRAEGKLNNTIKKLSDPMYSFLSTLYSVNQLMKEERNLAQAFAYNPFRNGFIGEIGEVNLTVYIPEPLMKLVFGR